MNIVTAQLLIPVITIRSEQVQWARFVDYLFAKNDHQQNKVLTSISEYYEILIVYHVDHVDSHIASFDTYFRVVFHAHHDARFVDY